MEPTIYKPGAYNTPGIYNGAGGIYNGRGVYNDGAGGGDFVEIGGKKYKFFIINNKKWLGENLDYIWPGLNVGGSIQLTPNANYYEDDELNNGWNGKKCGLLYNFAAVNYLQTNKNSLLPQGWRVPDNNDFNDLSSFLGVDAAFKCSKIVEWSNTWTGGNNPPELIPSGQRYGSNGTYNFLGSEVNLWTSERYDVWRDTGNNFSFAYVNNNAQLSIRLICDV